MDARQIIDMWPSRRDLALDAGRSPITVNSWFQRNRIPPEVFSRLCRAAARRGINLTADDLARSRAVDG